MKICWDNLEKLEYRPDRDIWIDKNRNFYIYKDSCKTCGEPFLARKDCKGLFCDYSCIRHSKETKNKISKGNKNKVFSDKHKKKLSDAAKIRFKNPENNPNYNGGYAQKNIPFYDTYALKISFCENVRRSKQDSNVLEVNCAYCGKWYIPTMFDVGHRIQTLNSIYKGEHRLYCSTECKQECPIFNKSKYQVGHPKSNKNEYTREVQPELRQLVFERDDYTCQKCGKHQNELDVGLHCHHLTGVELNPIESADIDNCITLCKTCHKEVHTLPGCGYSDFRRKKCE